MKLEWNGDNDLEDDAIGEDDIEDEETMIKLSHNVAKFLRHTAHYDDLLDEARWIPLDDAISSDSVAQQQMRNKR